MFFYFVCCAKDIGSTSDSNKDKTFLYRHVDPGYWSKFNSSWTNGKLHYHRVLYRFIKKPKSADSTYHYKQCFLRHLPGNREKTNSSISFSSVINICQSKSCFFLFQSRFQNKSCSQ